MFMSVALAASDCIAAGFSREGTIVPIEEPAREARASAMLKFNEATDVLQSAYDKESGALKEKHESAFEKMKKDGIDTDKYLKAGK